MMPKLYRKKTRSLIRQKAAPIPQKTTSRMMGTVRSLKCTVSFLALIRIPPPNLSQGNQPIPESGRVG